MIDLHCHLDLYPDPQAVVAECIARRLYVLSVTTVPSAFEGTTALARNEGRIRTALGLHPELAASRARELLLFERLLPRTRYVGEVGLDGSRDHRATLDVQRGVLTEVLQLCAKAGGKILSLHSRGATGAILDMLSAGLGPSTAILHWYIGSLQQVTRAAEIGCWFSVGPAMFSSNRGTSAIQMMPRNRILPESDGPFGIINHKVLRPWEAWSVVPLLASTWREGVHDVETQLKANFRTLVSSVE